MLFDQTINLGKPPLTGNLRNVNVWTVKGWCKNSNTHFMAGNQIVPFSTSAKREPYSKKGLVTTPYQEPGLLPEIIQPN